MGVDTERLRATADGIYEANHAYAHRAAHGLEDAADEIDRLRALEEEIREAGHYDTCDSALSRDMGCSCPARFVRPVPLVRP